MYNLRQRPAAENMSDFVMRNYCTSKIVSGLSVTNAPHKSQWADWTSRVRPTAVCTLRATLSIVPRSKADSGKSRWEKAGENERNLCLHAHLDTGDGVRKSKTVRGGREREKHIKSEVKMLFVKPCCLISSPLCGFSPSCCVPD